MSHDESPVGETNPPTRKIDFPWYDAIWFECYKEATTLLASKPIPLAKFEEAFDPVRVSKSFQPKLMEDLLNEEQLTHIRSAISKIPNDELVKYELFSFGRMIAHDRPEFLDLQHALTPLMSELIGMPLEPGYSFLSLYNNLGICELHMDAPISTYTLDICIEQSDVWPIYVSKIVDWPLHMDFPVDWQASVRDNIQFNRFDMREGDALIFGGSNQWHYRDRIPRTYRQNFCHLLFFHYVPSGLSELLLPSNWAKALDMPELEGIARRYEQSMARQTDSIERSNLEPTKPPGSRVQKLKS